MYYSGEHGGFAAMVQLEALCAVAGAFGKRTERRWKQPVWLTVLAYWAGGVLTSWGGALQMRSYNPEHVVEVRTAE